MRVRELEDHTPESIDDDEEEEEREGAGAGNGGTGEAAGETCYSLKPKSPVASDTHHSAYTMIPVRISLLSLPLTLPSFLSFLFFYSLALSFFISPCLIA